MFNYIFEKNLGRSIDVHLSSGQVLQGKLVKYLGDTVHLSGGTYLDKTEIQVAHSAIVAVEADV